MDEVKLMKNGESPTLTWRVPALRIPFSQDRRPKNGLENVEGHVLSNGGLIPQEVGLH